MLEWLADFLTSTRRLSSLSPVFVGLAPLGRWAKEPRLWRRSWKHSCSPSGSSETLIRRCSFREEASIGWYIIRNSALEEAAKEVLHVCGCTTAWMIWRGSTGHITITMTTITTVTHRRILLTLGTHFTLGLNNFLTAKTEINYGDEQFDATLIWADQYPLKSIKKSMENVQHVPFPKVLGMGACSLVETGEREREILRLLGFFWGGFFR